MRRVLQSTCPRCGTSKIADGLFKIKRECSNCKLNLLPESGYHLGAMMMAFFLTAVMMVPVIILLKVNGADPQTLILTPLVLYILVSPVLTHFAKIFWVHLEYGLASQWEKDSKK